MPRKLPWLKGSSTTTTVVASKRSVLPSSSPQKRKKIVRKELELEGGDAGPPSRQERATKDHPGLSSPPPDPPSESFMIDGMDDDDRYRMVEDEFLTVAQRFTVHLHAAEYKRLQKEAKSRNAETISSISRPVTGRMPDQTKRKVEAAERSKTQKPVLEGLIGKKVGKAGFSDDSDDGDDLPFVGTTLHGLMDSPRKKAISLTKISAPVTTRAAAGFKKPAAQSKPDKSFILGSPTPRRTIRQPQAASRDEDETASSGGDDDLDGPTQAAPTRAIPAPKLTALGKRPPVAHNASFSSIKKETNAPPRPKYSVKPSKDVQTVKTEHVADIFSSPPKPRSRHSRLEQARAQRAKEEKEREAKKKLNIIPTFL
ncbi:uncharacterized protein PAC_13313 [Phialocephala subalpina]|uniref:Uncharacterized protein n=1 Tax=Phialocephala subalpina TaxID=576137 RepID=A0A1L7XEL7_9HELO|nr:uncharacterized protein PAC_13313 [Phialocephala subalpina]